jgi:hypothetical protein
MSAERQVSIHRFEASLFPVNAYLVETATGVVAVDATLGVSDGRALGARVEALRKPLAASSSPTVIPTITGASPPCSMRLMCRCTPWQVLIR